MNETLRILCAVDGHEICPFKTKCPCACHVVTAKPVFSRETYFDRLWSFAYDISTAHAVTAKEGKNFIEDEKEAVLTAFSRITELCVGRPSTDEEKFLYHAILAHWCEEDYWSVEEYKIDVHAAFGNTVPLLP